MNGCHLQPCRWKVSMIAVSNLSQVRMIETPTLRQIGWFFPDVVSCSCVSQFYPWSIFFQRSCFQLALSILCDRYFFIGGRGIWSISNSQMCDGGHCCAPCTGVVLFGKGPVKALKPKVYGANQVGVGCSNHELFLVDR